MKNKSIIGTTCTCLAAISFNASAAIISTDRLAAGDNLITRDTVSGLDWLDLTETNNLSYDYVNGQLGVGGQFAGFRYATGIEVVALWDNFGINLSAGQPTGITSMDPNVEVAVSFLGNTYNEFNPGRYLYGVDGLTSDFYIDITERRRLGAIIRGDNLTTRYHAIDGDGRPTSLSAVWLGSYLVQTSVVPVPAAVWLFGSGLIGLIGFARRKKV